VNGLLHWQPRDGVRDDCVLYVNDQSGPQAQFLVTAHTEEHGWGSLTYDGWWRLGVRRRRTRGELLGLGGGGFEPAPGADYTAVHLLFHILRNALYGAGASAPRPRGRPPKGAYAIPGL
jgi:hypothetical protein